LRRPSKRVNSARPGASAFVRRADHAPALDVTKSASRVKVVSGSVPRDRRRRVLVLLAASSLFPLLLSFPASADDVGWISVCSFVRHRTVDPIVYPGEPGLGHLHDFYGSRGITADTTTYRSLLRTRTSCDVGTDRAGYWAPALYLDDDLIRPREGTFYYRSIVYPRRSVRPFPKGLKVIAGDSHAAGRQDTDVVYFGCTTLGGADPARDHPIDCETGWVTAHVNFPDCWDGERLDSIDHQRHMAYSTDPDDDDRYRCPRSHPVPVPRLTYAFEWPVHDGTRIAFSSGAFFTLHADFFNGWLHRKQRALVRRCIHGEIDCDKLGN
jgi:Domain of unknown function (DUF1996)